MRLSKLSVNHAFGGHLDVWLPGANGLQPIDDKVQRVTHDWTNSALGGSRYGLEVRKIGSDFFTGITIPQVTGAVTEFLLVQLGSTVNVGGTAFLLGCTNDGLRVRTNQIIVRASSSDMITVTPTVSPYDVIACRIVSADYRLYHKGVKTTAGGTFGSEYLNLALQISNDSIALLARWTNEQPSDDVIWGLLNDPWQLIRKAPNRVFSLPAPDVVWPFTESIYPNAVSLTNLTGASTDIDESPDSADANWLTAT